MKLAEVMLSYPFIRYRVEVSHFTSRRSTAIEWLILEAVQRVQANPDYQGMSIESFFSMLFGISDTNLMIRPCLLSLRDIGALQLDAIYDQTDMAQTMMGQLHLTEVGASMQKDGKLPGAESKDRIRFYYHLTTNQLIRDSKNANYQENPNGIPVLEIEDAEEIAFPAPLISTNLESLKTQKSDRPSWLQEETIIRQVVPVESELCWKSGMKPFIVGEGMRCSVEGNTDTAVNEAALSGLDLREASGTYPVMKVENPDTAFQMLAPSDQLQSLIEQMENPDNLCIADPHCRLDHLRTFTGGKNNVSVRILCNAEENGVKAEKGKLTVSVTDSLLPSGLVYLDRAGAVGCGSFSLTAGGQSRTAELAFIPNQTDADAVELAIQCAGKYYHEMPGMLHIFRILKMPEEAKRCLEHLVSSLPSVEEKLRCLIQLNDESVVLFKAKCVSDEQMNTMVLDAEQIAAQLTDVASAQNILEQYAAIDVLKNRTSTMEELLRILLRNIKESEQLADVHKLWKDIQSLGKQYMKLVKQEGLYRNLYSDTVLNELIARYPDENLYEMDEYTPLEGAVRDMRNLTDRTQEILPEISLFEETSEARMIETVRAHSQELASLIEAMEEWRNVQDKFESRIGDFEESVKNCPALRNTADNFRKLSSALSMFCCDKSLQYGKIYVLDTNALMNMPELLAMLEGKDTLIIIPQIVLSELDGLKKDEDQDRAFLAREAIRQIDNYTAFDWVNIKEESHPELLSKDLDAENPDCRIISVALKYIMHRPVVITNDGNMRNIAKSQGLSTMTTEGLAASMRQEEREAEQLKEKGKKGKKKRK